jgi:hypothetical protein
MREQRTTTEKNRKRRKAAYAAVIVALFGAGFTAGDVVGRRTPEHASGVAADRVNRTKQGPWGELEYVPITIAAPEELIQVKGIEAVTNRWFFGGVGSEDLEKFFASLGVWPEMRQQMLRPESVYSVTNGVEIYPAAGMVAALSDRGRRELCSVLARFSQNSSHFEFIAARPFDEYFAGSGVSARTVSLVRSAACLYGKYLIFVDLPGLLREVDSYDEKLRLLKAISRQATMLLKLRVTPRSDISALGNYWARACWAKDVKPMLESLSRVPDGARVDISQRLPPLPTSLLYTYPLPPSDVNGTPAVRDCHWTSFNFFRDPPEPRYSDPAFSVVALGTDYFRIFSDPRYGDIVLFVKGAGGQVEGIHSAVYLADDIVFSKNGGTLLQPWKLATISDLVDQYSVVATPESPIEVRYYRNKYY